MGLPLSLFIFMPFLFVLSLLHLVLTHSSPFMQPLCHHDDSSVLLQFKESLVINKSASPFLPPYCEKNVVSWTVEGDKSDCCSWDGVVCNEDTGHVIGINLSNNCLFGSINSNSSLFHLVHLQSLNLSNNDFNGSHIPSQVRDLSRLIDLDLSWSHFVGQIPFEISQLSHLSSLDLSYNYMDSFDHLITLELKEPILRILVANLTRLQDLDLSYVNMSSTVPNILANLSSLTHLSLKECGFSGQIPSEISQLSHLLSLDLSYNYDLELKKPSLRSLVRNLTCLQKLDLSWVNISSTVPAILANLSSLKFLTLRGCGLHGEFPAGVFKLSNLRFLSVSNNLDLTGYLPGFIWSSPLETLDLSLTSFSGELPASMGNLGFLTEMIMWNCNFSGYIPSSLGNLSKLTYLDLWSNSFVGNVPPSLGNLIELSHLDISYNQLTGPVPFVLLNLPQLLRIYLSNNLLSGEMHFGLMNETQLTTLDLSNNRLAGSITFGPTNLTQLSFLGVAVNELHGQISNSLFNLKNLEVLDLSENYLNDIVQFDEFVKLNYLTSLDISGNELLLVTKELDANATRQDFVGLGFSSCNLSEFPNFLRNQHGLVYLNMSNNKIHGQVPEWMLNTSTESLRVLDLSNNFLIGFGQHPVFLPWTSLAFLDLSSNLLQGSLPIPPVSTQFFHISNNSLTGNIPELFCNLSSLEVLDLANNNFSGSLP